MQKKNQKKLQHRPPGILHFLCLSQALITLENHVGHIKLETVLRMKN